jgi:galactokinase
MSRPEAPEAARIRGEAPGRVNLIGEHTDYNGGFVLPTAIPQRTRVDLVRRQDRRVILATGLFGGETRAEFALGEERPRHDWLDYLAGATWLLRREGMPLGGFGATISSTVPAGAGLSSSAALLVATFRALRQAFGLELDDVRIALLAQQVENEFVGARVGVMDPMAASLADGDTALFLDTRDLSFRPVAIPAAAMELFVIHSGVEHSHAHGGYNARRAECEEAVKLLGVAQLRDLGEADLGRLDVLPDLLRRRARHVITENARVLHAVAALEAADAAGLGRLFLESHRSMRDDYEVSTPEIDRLVEIAAAEPEVCGARLTGGGFGGSIVGIATPGRAAAAAARIAGRYAGETAREGRVLVPAPSR